MLKEVVIAFQSWGEAHQFIKRHRLFRHILFPGIIYIILFIAGMLLFWQSSDSVVSWISSKLGIEPWLQKERSEWLSFLFVMTGMMLRLMLVLFYFSFFKYLILVIGSPVFAWLSEKTEALTEEKEYTLNWADIKRDSVRNIKLSLRNCGWQCVYLIALIFLSLVPVVGWITPVIALLMECYYFGFSMLDYTLARSGFSPQQSSAFSGRHKGLAIGNGISFFAMHIIIVLAPAYAIVAATLTVHKVKNS